MILFSTAGLVRDRAIILDDDLVVDGSLVFDGVLILDGVPISVSSFATNRELTELTNRQRKNNQLRKVNPF